MKHQPLLSSQELEQIQIQARELVRFNNAKSAGHLSGPQQSAQRGAGLELQDLRSYEFGDDIRHIAWRSSAKTGRPMVKVFHAEKHERKLIAVEQHAGMHFGTEGELKAATAVRICALLCFSALARQVEVGGITSGQELHFFKYSSQLNHALALIRTINRATQNCSNISPSEITQQLQNVASQNCDIYVISDFNHWQKKHIDRLKPLAFRHNIHAIQIIDRGEQTLPSMGKVRIASPYASHYSVIDCNNLKLQQRYEAQLRAQQGELEQQLKLAGIHHLKYFTSGADFSSLSRIA